MTLEFSQTGLHLQFSLSHFFTASLLSQQFTSCLCTSMVYEMSAPGIELLPTILFVIPSAIIAGASLSIFGRYKSIHFFKFALMIIGVGLFNVLNAHSSQLNWSFAKVRPNHAQNSYFEPAGSVDACLCSCSSSMTEVENRQCWEGLTLTARTVSWRPLRTKLYLHVSQHFTTTSPWLLGSKWFYALEIMVQILKRDAN
jgi:hypothetical protein